MTLHERPRGIQGQQQKITGLHGKIGKDLRAGLIFLTLERVVENRFVESTGNWKGVVWRCWFVANKGTNKTVVRCEERENINLASRLLSKM
eukprot:g70160.t1